MSEIFPEGQEVRGEQPKISNRMHIQDSILSSEKFWFGSLLRHVHHEGFIKTVDGQPIGINRPAEPELSENITPTAE